MNRSMIRYVISWILRIEALLMVFPIIVGLIYHEPGPTLAYVKIAALCAALGFLFSKKPEDQQIYQKAGYVCVALAWIVLSVLGALPFVLTGEIPNYIQAVFEIVSGFTTTGSSILKNVEAVSHASLFWRSFSHWIGGMGVLVFVLMFIPVHSGSSMNLMRAESPGPDVSKFVPKVRNTAAILYRIYMGMTLLQIVLLLLSGMRVFDSLCITFGSAGTGGFGILNDSCASYTPVQQWIITIFMAAFGVNFSFYFFLIFRKPEKAFKMEEVRAYLAIILAAVALITIQVFTQTHMYHSLSEAIRAAAFQVSSIITTTGYSTTNFDLWPSFSKWILILLMIVGACAGSTGGGMKVSRVLVLLKTIKKEFLTLIHPRSIRKVMLDGDVVPHEVLRSINVFTALYFLIFGFSVLLISVDGFSLATNFSAVAATLNNIGPGLAGVGPTQNFSIYSNFSTIVLTFDMLAGRLEIFPLLMLFIPQTWKRV